MTEQNQLLCAATIYAGRGWRVLPLHTPVDGVCSCGRIKCQSQGKHPRTEHGAKDATTDMTKINEWWSMWPDANVGIATGKESGLVVLDMDGDVDRDSLTELEKKHGELPEGPESLTGNGYHKLFAYPTNGTTIRNSQDRSGLPSGIHVRGEGGFIVAPPSLHVTSRQYEWEVSHMPAEWPPPPIPSWLAPMLNCKAKRTPKQSTAVEASDTIPEGQRNDRLVSLAGSMRRRDMPAQAIEAALQIINQEQCQPPLDDEEVKRIARGITRYESSGKYMEGSTFIPKLLADDILSRFQFVNAAGNLYVYQQGVWKCTGPQVIAQACQELLGRQSRQHRINEVIYYIQTETFEDRSYEDVFEKRKGLINVKNGMLNYKKGDLLKHDPKYMSAIQIPVAYNPNAECPRINSFFDDVLPADCIDMAYEILGYFLTTDAIYQKAFMLTGPTNTGKSTFIKLLQAFVGESNVATVPLQELDENRFKRADLYGKLANVFADLDSRALQSSSYFKTIVSGDAIDAERKHQDPFRFHPFAKMIFSANELPRSRDNTQAYFKRWCIIPFQNQFLGQRDDKELINKITAPEELSGLLKLAIIHLGNLKGRGDFATPESTTKMLSEYQRQNDTVKAFVDACCVLDQKCRAERSELYETYSKFCEQEGFKSVSRRKFYDRLRTLPAVREVKQRDGSRAFDGICSE